MATTTTNYGFDIPQSTDLVKDGATAIATLGQDIDTAMNTALGTKKAGMVLLNTTSFSGVTGVSATANTFSSTYTNYKIFLTFTASSATENTLFRMRAAGTDATGTDYVYRGFTSTNSALANSAADSQTSWLLGQVRTGFASRTFYNIDLVNPFLALPTTFNLQTFFDTVVLTGSTRSGIHIQSVSYDSFSFFPASGTITGEYSIYGYNK
jgi:hypothetical protein